MSLNHNSRRINVMVMLAGLLLLFAFASAFGQASGFTYQGRLSDGGTVANGVYDMQFRLYDTATVGTGSLQGSPNTVAIPAVQVTNGIFTVQLDFGATGFPGADRFLEISVRPNGSGNLFIVLSPRQPITSTPYSVRSASAANADNATNATTATNATQLGGVAANQYVVTNDTRLSDMRSPTAGSSHYIQNGTPTTGSFNITGDGTVGGMFYGGVVTGGVVSAISEYDFAGKRVLSADADKLNMFVGIGVGSNGGANSFFGTNAGSSNTTAQNDVEAGGANSFFGSYAGSGNTTGNKNAFFGTAAGASNKTGRRNSFFGYQAGSNNAGGDNDIGGIANSFFGSNTGSANVVGNFNTLIGYSANVGSDNLNNATAIGAKAYVTQNNSLVLGSISGTNGATDDTNVGIGTTAPSARLHVAVNGGNIMLGDAGCTPPFTGIGFGTSLSGCTNYSLLGDGKDTIINRKSGQSIFFREANVTQMSIDPGGGLHVIGAITVDTLPAGLGGRQLCLNSSNQIGDCNSSSLRYKKDIARFAGGLDIVNRLRPISFTWKQGGMRDIGLGAEEVAQVEPLLTFRNDKGEIEGVKYNQLSAVFINAIKEQQAQIKQQQEENSALKVRFDRLERSLGKLQRSARRQHRQRR